MAIKEGVARRRDSWREKRTWRKETIKTARFSEREKEKKITRAVNDKGWGLQSRMPIGKRIPGKKKREDLTSFLAPGKSN